MCSTDNFDNYRKGYVLVLVISLSMAVTVWSYFNYKVKMLEEEVRMETNR